jgi:hypothetical protein
LRRSFIDKQKGSHYFFLVNQSSQSPYKQPITMFSVAFKRTATAAAKQDARAFSMVSLPVISVVCYFRAV